MNALSARASQLPAITIDPHLLFKGLFQAR